MKHILIAEDHSIVRLGTVMLVKEVMPDADIAQVPNFTEALAHLSQHPVDVAILDINMPGGDNVHMVGAVRDLSPSTKVLIFSSYDEHLYALRYIQAGADGYLSKDASEETFKEVLTKIFAGEKYMSDSLRNEYINELMKGKTPSADPLKTLSNRELEVAQMLIKGASTTTIAEKLTLHPTTVSTYKMRLFEKLKVNNVIDLAEKIKLYNEGAL